MENKQLKHRSIMKISTFTWRKIKTDAKMQIYIGFIYADLYCSL